MRSIITTVLCCAVLVLATATQASAQVWVAAEIWPGDDDPNTGNVPLYARGEAEVEGLGVVQSRIYLNRPSGSLITWGIGPSHPVSSITVEGGLHPDTVEVGWYQALAQGWKNGELYGCQASLLGAGPYSALYINFDNWEYRAYNCSHACQDSVTYWPSTRNFLSITGLRFKTFFSWCSPGVRLGHDQPPPFSCYLLEP